MWLLSFIAGHKEALAEDAVAPPGLLLQLARKVSPF